MKYAWAVIYVGFIPIVKMRIFCFIIWHKTSPDFCFVPIITWTEPRFRSEITCLNKLCMIASSTDSTSLKEDYEFIFTRSIAGLPINTWWWTVKALRKKESKVRIKFLLKFVFTKASGYSFRRISSIEPKVRLIVR